jgi:hypothetical protein
MFRVRCAMLLQGDNTKLPNIQRRIQRAGIENDLF